MMKIGIDIATLLNEESNIEEQKELLKKLKEDGHSIYIVLNTKDFDYSKTTLTADTIVNSIYSNIKKMLDEAGVEYDDIIVTDEEVRNLCVKHGINFMISDKLTLETYESISKLTGYPSIDKPWLKYYSDEQINTSLPEMTAYELLNKQCQLFSDKIAINYYGRKITYSELLKNIDLFEQKFKQLGIKKGDVVSICLPSIPEFITSFYALNKIGVTINNFDPRTNSERIKDFICDSKSSYLIMIDLVYPKIKKIEKELPLKKIIYVSATDSLPLGLKSISKAKELISFSKTKLPKDEKYVSWDSINNMKIINSVESDQQYEEIKKDDCHETIIYTGGTTGCPKGVLLSDHNINAVPLQYMMTPLNFDKELRFLDIMPPFIAYGLVFGIHLPLCLGMELILIPKFEPKKFDVLINKYKPSYFMGVPTHYESIISSKLLANSDLSHIVSAGAGGDSMNFDLEKRINSFFEEHNCFNRIAKGYGLTEVASVATACLANFCNDIGSVGIPLPKNTVAIFDFENGCELKYNEKGEVCINSPQIMKCYNNNESETNEVIKVHEDETKWIHSKDIGYLTQEGKLYIDGRIKRMIIRPDGHNIFPFELENIIKSHYAIKDCVVVGKKSVHNTQGEYPHAVIVLKDEYASNTENIELELKKLCEESLPERDVPYYYSFVESFPLTAVGKIDYKELEKIDVRTYKPNPIKKLIFSKE